jgi:transcriptional regulator with XRE-family HTH domain
MNARIRYIRQEMDLTQAQFADKINLSRNFVAMIEIGQREPSDRTISDICREFNVNEVWLRTGEGEPFQEESRQEQIMKFAIQTIKGSDEFRKQFVSMLAKMDADDWENLAKLFQKLAGETKK